jgi:photosystem II stability/assembly factor-like uncharacterized protein
MRPSRSIIWGVAAFVTAFTPAYGADGYLIRIYYGDSPARLADTSFVPYAVYDEYAVGEVSPGYASRLAARAFRFDVLAEDPALKKIWDVYRPAPDLPPSADILLEVSPSHYIIATPRDVDVVVGDRARRLKPIAADFRALAKKQPRLVLEPRDEVADVVAAVNRGRYEKAVRDLVAFGTRYSYSQKCKQAADYLEDALAAVNLRVNRDRYFGPEMKKVAAANRDVAWATGELGLVARTTDGGARWEVIGPVGEGEAAAVACVSAEVAWVGQERGALWATEDGGRIWGKRTIGQGDITDLHFLDIKRGWAVTSDGEVIRTVDGGDSWQRVSNVGAWLRGISFSDANNGLMCGSYGYLARTVDGGVSWQRVGAAPNFRLEAVAHRTAAEAYVVGEGGTVLRSADAGATWAAVNLRTDRYLRDVDFARDTGFIVGSVGDFWRTRDGSSWEKKAPPKYVLYSVAATPPEVVWCGTGGGALLYSPDGGDSWQDQAANADPTSTFVWDNVWARQRRRGGAPGTVLVCAHYDSISELSSIEKPDAPAPGADDNATGTAAVLELARASKGQYYYRDVIYCCFSGEELGLLGSSHFASKMASAGEPLVAVLNMDMLGYADKLPEDLDVVTNRASIWLYEYTRRAAAAYVRNLGVDVTVDDLMRRSDHAPFWALGYTSNLITEDWPPTNPYANTSKDTLEKIDFDVATLMTRGVAAAAASLASPAPAPLGPSLDLVEVYPNPYKADVHKGWVYFANLTPRSKIKFYNVAGEFITEGGNGDEPIWALDVGSGKETIKASGVYIYIIETPAGEKKVGKLAVIR